MLVRRPASLVGGVRQANVRSCLDQVADYDEQSRPRERQDENHEHQGYNPREAPSSKFISSGFYAVHLGSSESGTLHLHDHGQPDPDPLKTDLRPRQALTT